jgi:2-polyprenyl-3-methyl-5-hydroxy-6-metoxy-1,4-benzoquinol methylase
MCGGTSVSVCRYDIGLLGGYWAEVGCKLDVEIRRCDRFGSYFTNALPSIDLVVGQYRLDTASYYDDGELEPDTKSLRCVELIKRRIPLGAKLIDVGGGNGAFAVAASRAGYESWLQDLGSPSVRRLVGEGVTFVADLDKLEARSFDAVTLWDVYEHVWPHEPFLAPIRRILKPAGLLIIEIPSPNNLIPLFLALGALSRSPKKERMYAQICNFGHLQLLSKAELLHTLPAHGFTVDHAETLSELSYKGAAYARRVFAWAPLAKTVGALFDSKPFRRVVLGNNKTFVVARMT